MDDHQWLAERFEEKRAHLQAVAHRMLGSASEAEDAVQEAWLRLSRSGAGDVENIAGWMTTIVGRVCLDMLRAKRARREEALEGRGEGRMADEGGAADPEGEALLAESVGLAVLVVLETLAPAERVAFVLHDMFGVPFDQIAPIVGRSPAAARQLASRARRRVRGASFMPEDVFARQKELVEAYFTASRRGDLEAVLAVLDPDAVLRADASAVALGVESEFRGADAVARTFLGRAQGALLALVDGAPGAVWAPGGRPRVVFRFTVAGRRIVEIALVADPERIGSLDLAVLGGSGFDAPSEKRSRPSPPH